MKQSSSRIGLMAIERIKRCVTFAIAGSTPSVDYLFVFTVLFQKYK